MTITRIHAHNATSFIGKRVRVDYGAYHPWEEGLVVGCKDDEQGTHLVVALPETVQLISTITDAGVGCHLIEEIKA